MNNLSVTIGIASSFAGENLLHTAKTIVRSVGKKTYKLAIYADNIKIDRRLAAQLKRLNFSVHWTPGQGSYFKKAGKLINATTSDVIILTQDDITFQNDTIKEIVSEFETNPRATMVGIRVLPLPPQTLFERAMASMIYLVDTIARLWNDGDNYLSSSGRCLAFRTSFLKKIFIPEVCNSDMFLYLANERAGGTFIRSKNAKVYIRAPQNLSDQTGPSSRFQHSRFEMEKYFKTNLSEKYKIPPDIAIKALIDELSKRPIQLIGYLIIFLATRLFRKPADRVLKAVWIQDASTKNVL